MCVYAFFLGVVVVVLFFILKFTLGDVRFLRARGTFLKSPGNLPGAISVFVDKCFLTEVIYC